MIKPVLRAKKAEVTVTRASHEVYLVRCPHCKTFLSGGFNRDSLRISCRHCQNKIDLVWEGKT
jgi:hypothetical protein